MAKTKTRKRNSVSRSAKNRKHKLSSVLRVVVKENVTTNTVKAGKISASMTENEVKLQLAIEHDTRFRDLEAQKISAWAEQAEIAQIVHDNREWEVLTYEVVNCNFSAGECRDHGKLHRHYYKGFNDWLEQAAPQSRSGMYASMRLLQELKDDVPKEDLRQMKEGNAKVIRMMPKKARQDPEVIRRAKTMQPRKFVEHIETTRPELHIESKVAEKFLLERTQRLTVEAALHMADVIEAGHDLDEPMCSREVLLEKICATYLVTHKEQYDRIKAGIIDGEYPEVSEASPN